jgi:O-Antigen ligase/Tetratricopeptide repeat
MIQRTACLTRRFGADPGRGHYRARVTTRPRVGLDAGQLGQLGIAAGLPFGAVLLTGAVNGGYFPSEWGWPTLAFVLVSVLAVLVRERIVLTRFEWLAIGSLAAFELWTLASILWASSATEPMLSAERTLVYVLFVAALLLVISRTTAPAVLVGVLAAAVGLCGYALVERLWPGRLEAFPPPEGFQLAGSIGYWNGLGILAAMGVLLAAGLAASPLPRWLRAATGCVLPLLLATLALTFSRGSWLALLAGAVVALVVARERLRLAAFALLLGVPGAVAVLVTLHTHALTRAGASLHTATASGSRLALELAACMVASGAAAFLLAEHEPRARLSRTARRAAVAAVAAAAVLVLLAALVRLGGPSAAVDRATRSFRAPLPASGGDLDRRLVSISSNGRDEYWRVAGREIAAHPWLGGGAGSFERYWHRERRTGYEARNAHNLYLETLAELGLVGLALLLLALAVPLAGLRRDRGSVATTAAAAYTAFLAHAALDWDWQLPAVTLAALACGVTLLVCARPPGAEDGAGTPLRPRFIALAALVPLAVVAVVVAAGNGAIGGSDSALERGDTASAERLARRAHRWAPWSSQPWQRLGDAALAAGDLEKARRSYRRAIALDETEWSLWFGLAQASRGSERASALGRALALNPRSPELAALRRGG